MSDQFLAEIRILPYNFPPTGWAFCDGQLMPISQNTALFSLLGTFYGGDGKSTFALPNLQGSLPMHQGQGSGLSERFLGEQSGTETVTLIGSETPFHTHAFNVSNQASVETQPPNQFLARGAGGLAMYDADGQPTTNMAFNMLAIQGASFPHNNMQPYLGVTFSIALQGIFPARP